MMSLFSLYSNFTEPSVPASGPLHMLYLCLDHFPRAPTAPLFIHTLPDELFLLWPAHQTLG